MITIHRTPPAHQNPVRQGNNSGWRYRDLPDHFKAVLREWAFDDMLLTQERIARLAPDAPAWEKWQLASGARALHEIAAFGHPGGSRWMAEALSDPEINRLVAMLDMNDDAEFGPARLAARVLHACVGRLVEAALLKLLARLDPCFADVPRFIAAPRATPNVWKACLERSPTTLVRTALAAHPEAIAIPEIRRGLHRHANTSVLTSLLRSAPDEEFVRTFRKLVRRDPDMAATVLAEHPERTRLLGKTDFLPLMQFSRQEHRVLAIMLMAEARADQVRNERRFAQR
ncbi:MAG TPA: hypothetical protein VKZ61_00125 [Thermomicrobiales bacterium]|nr:hypothetical protein [Thermomicrobiales bacterium]